MTWRSGKTRVVIPCSGGQRTWAADPEADSVLTDHPREVVETPQTHMVLNRVEAACRRTDVLERGRQPMDTRASYLAGENREPDALPIR